MGFFGSTLLLRLSRFKSVSAHDHFAPSPNPSGGFRRLIAKFCSLVKGCTATLPPVDLFHLEEQKWPGAGIHESCGRTILVGLYVYAYIYI